MHKASFGLAVAIGLATSCFFAVGTATADPYKWCAEYAGADSGGGTNCGFVALEQCRATISGVGGLSNGTGGIGQKVTLTRSDMITF